ncbi:MAG TPA: hypothetical protein VKR62_06080 [Roseiarcus sp.]|nr:hypothetical protein [Roseiarcus sp.]
MASIVEALFEDVFKASASKDGWYAFQITDEAFERLRFAVFRTSSMASDIDVANLKAIEEART